MGNVFSTKAYLQTFPKVILFPFTSIFTLLFKRPRLTIARASSQGKSFFLMNGIQLGTTTTTVYNEVIVHENLQPGARTEVFEGDENDQVIPIEGANPLISTLERIMQGGYPRNSALNEMFERAKLALESQRNSPLLNLQGQVLVENTRDILETAQYFFMDINREEQLQTLLFDAKNVQQTEEQAYQEELNGSNSARELAILFLTSKEFRCLMEQFLDIMENLITPYTSKVFVKTRNGVQKSSQYSNNLPTDIAVYVSEQVRSLLRNLSKKPDLKLAVRNFFILMDQKSTRAAETSAGIFSYQSEMMLKLRQDAKKLMEQFIGIGTLDNLLQLHKQLIRVYSRDEVAHQFFSESKFFIFEAMRTTTNLCSDQIMTQIRKLVVIAREEFVKYEGGRRTIALMIENGRAILSNFRNEMYGSEFGAKIRLFLANLIVNDQGRFDADLMISGLKQLRTVIVPVLAYQIEYIPIPKIQGSNDKFEFSVDNLVFHGVEFIPGVVDFKVKDETKFNVHNLMTQSLNIKAVMIIHNIRTEFKDVMFWARKKTFPRIEEGGLVDISIGGEGLTLKIAWNITAMINGPFMINVEKGKCELDELEIRIHDAKHSHLANFATSLFSGTIKQMVAKSLVEELVHRVNAITDRLNSFLATRPMKNLRQVAGAAFGSILETTSHAGVEPTTQSATLIKEELSVPIENLGKPEVTRIIRPLSKPEQTVGHVVAVPSDPSSPIVYAPDATTVQDASIRGFTLRNSSYAGVNF